MNWFVNLKPFFIYILVTQLFCYQAKSQAYFGEGPVKWENNIAYKIPADASKYETSDLVILSDVCEFHFYNDNNEKLVRNLKIKINTAKGLEQFKHFRTPESFDIAYDEQYYKQGRQSKVKIPFIKEFKVTSFNARKYSHQRWSNVTIKDSYEKIRWIKPSGEFMDEDLTVFKIGTLAVGDVLEIYYEANFSAFYGNNIFYFHGAYPKLSCEYNFILKIDKEFSKTPFILPVNVPEANMVTKNLNEKETYVINTKQIKLNNLPAINYPSNSFEGGRLPHVKADFSYYRNTFVSVKGNLLRTMLSKSLNFEWVVSTDTSIGDQTRIFDKQFTSVRRFMATLPPAGSDSQNVIFFRALCDTFNNFRFISANQLYYNESNLYNLYSGDHILKRRLPEQWMWKLYEDILKDNKMFYYLVNIQDKRYGDHSKKFRAHHGYERNLIALPVKDSYIYFMPRIGGVKYHLNELPFYYEAGLAALSPMNYQPDTKDKGTKIFRIIKTHHGTFNENTRTENATIKIDLDSMVARLNIKESLSGQFSTILRHLYLNELIDSTIAPNYYKRCVDKPNAHSTKIKTTSNITEFPFRYNFSCQEQIALKDSTSFSLKNWFSFPLSKSTISEKPNLDYYFDFDFSDSYNFMLEFNRIVEVKNLLLFNKKIDNEFFNLESEIVKNSESAYLVKAKLIVKQRSVPVDKCELLMELLEDLEQLNNFKLEVIKK